MQPTEMGLDHDPTNGFGHAEGYGKSAREETKPECPLFAIIDTQSRGGRLLANFRESG